MSDDFAVPFSVPKDKLKMKIKNSSKSNKVMMSQEE
jgi:hypothetical protein